VICDPPPDPRITIIVNMDTLASGFSTAEFDSITIIKKTIHSDQEIIDTLSNSCWYYISNSVNPDYPKCNLYLGRENDNQIYEYVITNGLDVYYYVDSIFLEYEESENSSCCSFSRLTGMSFNLNGERIETTDSYFALLIEK
jgi:hypothetical protein